MWRVDTISPLAADRWPMVIGEEITRQGSAAADDNTKYNSIDRSALQIIQYYSREENN